MPVALKKLPISPRIRKTEVHYYSQDCFSYLRNKKKIIRAATISGRLATLLGYSFTDIDIIQGFGFLICELFAPYYQKKAFKNYYFY